jgi:hypothetical protein
LNPDYQSSESSSNEESGSSITNSEDEKEIRRIMGSHRRSNS